MRNSLVSLDFLDEDRLLFTFRVPGLLHREAGGDDLHDEREIRAVVLRLPQGTVEANTVWTLHDRARYLYMLENGQFLLRDRNELKLGDATLQLKPYLRFPGPVLWVEMDPSRKFLVTGSSEPQKESPADASGAASVRDAAEEKPASERSDLILRILRRDSGKVVLVSHVRSAVHLPINADGYLEALRSRGEAWMLNFNPFDGGTRVLGTVNSVCSPTVDFVSGSEFLLRTCGPGGNPRLVAMATNGRRLWEDQNSGPSVWPLLVIGPNGSRLARETLLSAHGVNAANPLGTDDIKGQSVEIFDAASGKVALRAEASPIFDAGGNVAISPSGLRVAVVMEGAIQVFNLPPVPPVPEISGN